MEQVRFHHVYSHNSILEYVNQLELLARKLTANYMNRRVKYPPQIN